MNNNPKKLVENLKKAEEKIRLERRLQDKTDWAGNYPDERR